MKMYTPVGKFLQDHYDAEREKRIKNRPAKLIGLNGEEIDWPELPPRADFSHKVELPSIKAFIIRIED